MVLYLLNHHSPHHLKKQGGHTSITMILFSLLPCHILSILGSWKHAETMWPGDEVELPFSDFLSWDTFSVPWALNKIKSFCGKLLVLIRHDYGPASQTMSWIMLSINSGHDISLDRRQFVQVCFFVLPRCAGYWTMKHFCLLQVKWPMDDIGEKLYHHLDALRNDWPKITAMHQQVRNYVSIAPIFL